MRYMANDNPAMNAERAFYVISDNVVSGDTVRLDFDETFNIFVGGKKNCDTIN